MARALRAQRDPVDAALDDREELQLQELELAEYIEEQEFEAACIAQQAAAYREEQQQLLESYSAYAESEDAYWEDELRSSIAHFEQLAEEQQQQLAELEQQLAEQHQEFEEQRRQLEEQHLQQLAEEHMQQQPLLEAELEELRSRLDVWERSGTIRCARLVCVDGLVCRLISRSARVSIARRARATPHLTMTWARSVQTCGIEMRAGEFRSVKSCDHVFCQACLKEEEECLLCRREFASPSAAAAPGPLLSGIRIRIRRARP
eukprot:tig00020801_g13894.t1